MAEYFGENFLIGHSRVCYKKAGSTYFIKDLVDGLLEIQRKKMKEHLNNVRKMKGRFDIICYKY